MFVLEGPPSQVGISLGLGIFLGCSPLYGLHGLLAVFLATLFRLTPLIAVLGTQISIPPLGVVIVGSEVGLGEWIRYGHWTLPAGADSRLLIRWVWDHALLSWAIGSVLIGPVAAVLGGAIAWGVTSVSRRRVKAKSAS